MGIRGPASECDTLRLGFLSYGMGQGHPNASIQRIEHVLQTPGNPQTHTSLSRPPGVPPGAEERQLMLHRRKTWREWSADVCLVGTAKVEERIQRRGLGNVRVGGGHAGPSGGGLREGELGLNPAALQQSLVPVTTSLRASVSPPGKGLRVCSFWAAPSGSRPHCLHMGNGQRGTGSPV